MKIFYGIGFKVIIIKKGMLVIMEKNLKLGLVLGRYNHIHSGHTEIIN